jgi:hypothetical protein
MNARGIVSLAALALAALAADCKNGVTPPSPPPPPPPGAPVVTAGRDSTIQVGTTFGLSATFTDTSSGGAPWNYGIDWGDGTNTTGTKNAIAPITGTHTYTTEGNHELKVSVTNSFGRTGTDQLAVDATAPVIIAAGDIADCNRSQDDATGALLPTLSGIVMTLGDNAYVNGTPTEFATCYDPAWGNAKNRTRPVAGNHDYYNPGATKNADGYFGYFGAAAGDPTKGYYDFTLGSWLVIVLNTGTESASYIAAGSAQELWLRAELASHSQACVLALWHHPRFSTVSQKDPIRPEVGALWDALYQYGADLVLNGHDHVYERFAPQKPDGTLDNAFGIRQFTVGTGGGESLYAWQDPTPPPSAHIEARDNETVGVIKLTLHSNSYDWQFVPAAGGTFTDSGSGNCHGKP